MGNHMVPGKGMVVQGIGLLDMAFEECVLFDCTAFLLPIELKKMEWNPSLVHAIWLRFELTIVSSNSWKSVKIAWKMTKTALETLLSRGNCKLKYSSNYMNQRWILLQEIFHSKIHVHHLKGVKKWSRIMHLLLFFGIPPRCKHVNGHCI